MQNNAEEGSILHEILSRIEKFEQKSKNAENPPELTWLDNEDFCRMLRISKRTAQNYRDKGVVAFSQIGSKVYYKLADVHELLESNRVAPLRNSRR